MSGGDQAPTGAPQEARLSPKAVQAQLEKILRSSGFSNAPVLSRMLRHVVVHSLEGNPGNLKEYSLGVEVFDRGESFDPRVDTIVRVQARRLRAKLKDYYEAEGRFDPVVIEIPKGHYIASFRSAGRPDFPSRSELLEDLEAHRKGSSGMQSQSTGPHPHGPPVPRTLLIGREIEIAAVRSLLLGGKARLLTITGAGGSGKTRLAIEAARTLNDAFPGGVFFVSLATLADSSVVASTIADVLGLRHTGGKNLAEALQHHVRMTVRVPTLLFLDNFEHLLAAAPMVVGLLEACAQLKILVTSRAPLEVYGEYDYPLSPLPLPEPDQFASIEALSRNPAVTLFVDRTVAVKPDFALSKEDAPVVAEICRRLDGLPLAIELAAARTKLLSPGAVLERLQSRLELLTRGAVDLPARQQTLRHAIDWSHDLLSPPEQKMFRRLSVFAGGCTLEGAEAVCNTRRDLNTDVLEGMASLVGKSLVEQTYTKNDESRFTMLETIREYGLERLRESGEFEATRHAHAAYCLVLAEEGNPQLTTAQRVEWLARCAAEYDNFRAAFDWLMETDNGEWALRLGVALFEYWEKRELLAEGYERLGAVLKLRSASARTALRAKAVSYFATLATNRDDWEHDFLLYLEALDIYRELGDRNGVTAMLNNLGGNRLLKGDHAAARSWFEQSLELCRELGDPAEIAAALSNLAQVAHALGEYSEARSLLQEALTIFRNLGDQGGTAWSISRLGDVARSRGDLTEARRMYQEGVEIFRRLGDGCGVARAFVDLGYLACEEKDYAPARSSFEKGLRSFLELGHKRGVAKALEGLACLATLEKAYERALTLAAAAAALRHTIGARPRAGEQADLDRSLQPAWRHLDPALAQRAWDAPWTLSLEEAVQYALAPSSIPTTSTRS